MKHKLMALIALLLLLSLACSAIPFLGGDAASADPDTAVSDDIDDDQDDDGGTQDDDDNDTGGGDDDDGGPPDDGDAFSFDSDGLDELDSYRATILYEMTKDDGTIETLSFEQAEVREPPAQHLRMSSSDGEIEYIQIGDQLWIRFGEEWIQSSADDGDMGDDFGGMLSDPSDWLGDIEDGDYEYLGQETVNGVKARHYRIEYDEGWMSLLDQADADGDIDSGTADVWITAEPSLPEFVVRYVIELEGQLDGEDGSATLSQDVTDVNQPISIEPPEGVAAGGLPEGVPVYPDASGLTNFGGMTTFETTDSVETVNDFYVDSLEGAGWERSEGGFSTDDLISSTWTKDDATLALNITADDDDVVTVLIMVEGE